LNGATRNRAVARFRLERSERLNRRESAGHGYTRSKFAKGYENVPFTQLYQTEATKVYPEEWRKWSRRASYMGNSL
jgi:hypothetical protein